KRAYCLKIQPATGSFARNLIYSTKPMGISKPLPINPVSGIAGNASGSAVTEILNDQAGKTGVKFQKGNQK
ncbi:hypothetical protein PO497_04785, partial [Klebsiella variicola]